ncbi:phosphohydrolase [Vibrio azureus]|uniref:Pyridoxamine 5'-phosphate oxidase N-terminal domain-containing protein n=1 Tax=Vibrio azureus NBRC 104587 TaxID=1219077 RepID=U3AS37_9VIBR|nr:pyridoxamine 5'-phosphate oxidase family protein [Vibrio azureus]AUI87975.1 phosphohydrolase [Vibrio azureus]GAD76072.1 hypothetical protein VAZ01S_036_00160 [Vibrio azureus NBRC 104587]
MSQINTLNELAALYPEPSTRARNKVQYQIDSFTKIFIEHSHFALLATTDSENFTDISPRGGEPGFIKVLDSHTLLLPDSSGNNRIDSFKNIINNPHVGLLLMVNGIDEVVRLKGSATLHIDEELKALCPDGKKAPKLVVKIDVKTVYFHCAKAIMRGKLWQEDHRVERSILPSLAQIMKTQQNNSELTSATQEEMIKYYNSTL